MLWGILSNSWKSIQIKNYVEGLDLYYFDFIDSWV